MLTAVAPHIHLDDAGVAWVDDANTKVIEIALDQIAHGFTPEQIHEQHPHLSLPQVYAALAYYHDHREELDAEIERRDKEVEAMEARARDAESPAIKRLRHMGKLP